MLQFWSILPEKGMLYSLSLSHWLDVTTKNRTVAAHCVTLFIELYCAEKRVDPLIQDCFHHATSNAQNTWIAMPWFPGQRDTNCTSILNRQCHSKQFFPWLKWKIRTWMNIAFVRRTCYDQTTVSMVPWWLQWFVPMGNQTYFRNSKPNVGVQKHSPATMVCSKHDASSHNNDTGSSLLWATSVTQSI